MIGHKIFRILYLETNNGERAHAQSSSRIFSNRDEERRKIEILSGIYIAFEHFSYQNTSKH